MTLSFINSRLGPVDALSDYLLCRTRVRKHLMKVFTKLQKATGSSEKGGRTGPRLTLCLKQPKSRQNTRNDSFRDAVCQSATRRVPTAKHRVPMATHRVLTAGQQRAGSRRCKHRRRAQNRPASPPRRVGTLSVENPDSGTLRSRGRHQEPGASSVQTVKPEQRAAEREQKTQRGKSSESKSWVLAKIDETEKPLGRLIRTKTHF